MHRRLSITLPERTVRLLERVAKRGNRSRIIALAIERYVGEVGRKELRQRLKEGAIRRAHRDLGPAEAARVHPFYLGMLSGHSLLHDREGFFAAVLARLRSRLQELGAQRLVDEDGYEYWDLKPDWKPGDVVEL